MPSTCLLTGALFLFKSTEAKLPPSISVNLIFLFPAKSIIVGKRSLPEIGVLDSDPFLIPGPEIISGTRTPPS